MLSSSCLVIKKSSIPVVYIKEELKDASPLVKIELETNSLLITEKYFNGTDYSMDEIYIKNEPLPDDLVSEFYDKAFQ